jgi:hypothetical protein
MALCCTPPGIYQLTHRVLLKTHEHYFDKEAAHAVVDGIRDRCTKHQRITGSEETPLQLDDAETTAETFARV